MSTETIQLIEKKAAAMPGRKWMFNGTGEAYTVKNCQVLNGRLLMNTDKKLFDVELEHALKLLNEFHSGADVVDNDGVTEMTQPPAPVPPSNVQYYQPNTEVRSLSGVDELKRIMMDNIRRVQENKEYVPQATAVDNSMKTLIELAKVEIKALELQDRLR